MQISRHWRMNAQRYRMVGVRYEDGTVSIQNRPYPTADYLFKQNEAISVPNWPIEVKSDALKKQS